MITQTRVCTRLSAGRVEGRVNVKNAENEAESIWKTHGFGHGLARACVATNSLKTRGFQGISHFQTSNTFPNF